MKSATWVTLGLACAYFGQAICSAGQGKGGADAAKPKVGIYDSRALAYAYFWSDANQQKLTARYKEAKAAKDAGHTERFKELEAPIKAEQERNHLQVFSTAPVENVLAEIQDRVESVKKESGVSQLLSKWDSQALRAYSPSQQVDVTDSLLRGFKLTEQQQKVLSDLRKKDPIPLKKAKDLMQKGEL